MNILLCRPQSRKCHLVASLIFTGARTMRSNLEVIAAKALTNKGHRLRGCPSFKAYARLEDDQLLSECDIFSPSIYTHWLCFILGSSCPKVLSRKPSEIMSFYMSPHLLTEIHQARAHSESQSDKLSFKFKHYNSSVRIYSRDDVEIVLIYVTP